MTSLYEVIHDYWAEMEIGPDVCDGCEYLNEWKEQHEYWGAQVSEDMAECAAPNYRLCWRLMDELKEVAKDE